MLVTFSSKNAPSVLMLSQHARVVLEAAGKTTVTELPERGVFTPEQLPAAVAALEKAIAAAPVEHDDVEDSDEPPAPPMAREVGFAQRAYPLLDMFRRAQASGDNVMWELSRGY
ncbi:MAG: DUF1840 domain-containing protein [Burkholderiaceae bacterium]|nr:DUF1840 domain-containing protein [Burkholderiaceae bacterium]